MSTVLAKIIWNRERFDLLKKRSIKNNISKDSTIQRLSQQDISQIMSCS